MIHAYSKEYLSDAMENLGEAFDYAINGQALTLSQFTEYFINTDVAKQFQQGNPKYICGMSGTELVLDVLQKSGLSIKRHRALKDYERSPEYWTGWILAYYQWFSGRRFCQILEYFPIEDIRKLYSPLHEAPEQKFAEIAEERITQATARSVVKVQALRKKAELSQRQLSEASGVNLRTLQQYENRSKDIQKASGITLLSLSKVLGCSIEELMDT